MRPADAAGGGLFWLRTEEEAGDVDFRRGVGKVVVPEGHVGVVLRGRGGRAYVGDAEVSAAVLAVALRRSGAAGRPIYLIMCEAGRFARRLATETGQPVEAADDLVWLDELSGAVVAGGGFTANGQPVPPTAATAPYASATGRFRTYLPGVDELISDAGGARPAPLQPLLPGQWRHMALTSSGEPLPSPIVPASRWDLAKIEFAGRAEEFERLLAAAVVVREDVTAEFGKLLAVLWQRMTPAEQETITREEMEVLYLPDVADLQDIVDDGNMRERADVIHAIWNTRVIDRVIGRPVWDYPQEVKQERRDRRDTPQIEAYEALDEPGTWEEIHRLAWRVGILTTVRPADVRPPLSEREYGRVIDLQGPLLWRPGSLQHHYLLSSELHQAAESRGALVATGTSGFTVAVMRAVSALTREGVVLDRELVLLGCWRWDRAGTPYVPRGHAGGQARPAGPAVCEQLGTVPVGAGAHRGGGSCAGRGWVVPRRVRVCGVGGPAGSARAAQGRGR